MNNIIEINNISFTYNNEDETASEKVLDGVSLNIEEGSFVAVLGKNGSGKSTLAKHINVLLVPSEGTVFVKGMNTNDEDKLWDIRQSAGMVFQNPDNQIVSAIVEDDVAFGPENLGVDPVLIRERVDKALEEVNMTIYREKEPHKLSGGQKQRIAIAGVLAMKPSCIVFDEPTAMLDPKGRKDILKIIKNLSAEGITIILITHFMDEAALADRVVVMENGKIKMDGKPSEVFQNEEFLDKMNLTVPLPAKIVHRLKADGYNCPQDIVKMEEIVEYLCQFK